MSDYLLMSHTKFPIVCTDFNLYFSSNFFSDLAIPPFFSLIVVYPSSLAGSLTKLEKSSHSPKENDPARVGRMLYLVIVSGALG